MINQDLEIKSDFEIVGKKNFLHCHLSVMYRPTNNDEVYSHALANTIINICGKYPKDTIWENMNLPDIDWEEYTITGNQYKKVINKLLRSTIDDVDLEKVINFPTDDKTHLIF